MNHIVLEPLDMDFKEYSLSNHAFLKLSRGNSHKFKYKIHRRSKIGIFIVGILLTLLLVFNGIGGLFMADADTKERGEKIYTSISIQRGDSLWKLAEEYLMTEDAARISSYIEDIKSINQISGDTLYSDQNLIVYYYNDLVE